MVIPRYEPDEPMKYLGILSTVLLSWGWAVDAATTALSKDLPPLLNSLYVFIIRL